MEIKLNTQQTARISATLMILAIAGMACGAAAGYQPSDTQDSAKMKHTNGQPVSARSVVFISAKSQVKGMVVKNSEDKSLGTIDDMIIDRGSGRIQYLVDHQGPDLIRPDQSEGPQDPCRRQALQEDLRRL
jgi:hypothetical protein